MFDPIARYASPREQHPFSVSIGNGVPSGSTKRVNAMQTQQTTPSLAASAIQPKAASQAKVASVNCDFTNKHLHSPVFHIPM